MAGVSSGYPRLSSGSHAGSSPVVVAVDNPSELSLGVGRGAGIVFWLWSQSRYRRRRWSLRVRPRSLLAALPWKSASGASG